MIMKANKQIGFIYKDNESIDKILKDGDVVFERGFLREKTSTTLPITFGGVGKDLKDYKIYGNTYQNSTSGKNLIGFDDQQKTLYGITATFVDNVITLNGALTQNYAVNYAKSKDINLQSNANKNYILSYKVISGTKNVKLGISFRDENGTQLDYIQDSNATDLSTCKSISSSTLNATKYFNFFVRTKEQIDNLIIELQLEEGSTATEFEPYTGGQPSPNPDYTQEIISCGDRTKNLFDKHTTNVLNAYFDNSHINITADTTNKVIYLPCEPSTTYSITQGASSLSNHLLQIGTTNTKPEIGTTTYSFEDHRNDLTFTYTTNSTAKYIIIRLRNGDYTDSTYMSTVQLEEDSTATPYEPYYDGYKIPVNVRSENLFDKDNFVEGYIDSNGVYHTDSSIKANALSDYIKIDNNTDYIFSAKNNIYGLNFALYDSNKVFIKRVTSNNTSYNQINSETANYCRVWCNISQQTNITSELIEQYEIQLIKSSSKPSKYIPYYNETTNIYLDEPLRKIGKYSDYIDFINGKVVRNVGSKLIDGSLDWVTSQFASGKRIYTLATANIDSNIRGVLENTDKALIIADKYKTESIEDILTVTKQYAIGLSKTKYLSIQNQDYTYSADLIQSLTDEPVVLNYALATPTEESITLPNIPTIDGNNTLNIETEITPSQVYIKYKSNE